MGHGLRGHAWSSGTGGKWGQSPGGWEGWGAGKEVCAAAWRLRLRVPGPASVSFPASQSRLLCDSETVPGAPGPSWLQECSAPSHTLLEVTFSLALPFRLLQVEASPRSALLEPFSTPPHGSWGHCLHTCTH